MNALESLNPFFNSISSAPAEGVVPAGVPRAIHPALVGTSDSLIEPAPMAPNPGVETRREEGITASPAAFSFQPDFEKLFNAIIGEPK